MKRRQLVIPHERPICLYNTEKKELMGIFSTNVLAEKYLFGEVDYVKKRGRVAYAFRTKQRITLSQFVFPIAVRYASTQQLDLLEGDYVVMNGYDPGWWDLKKKWKRYKNQ